MLKTTAHDKSHRLYRIVSKIARITASISIYVVFKYNKSVQLARSVLREIHKRFRQPLFSYDKSEQTLS
jgi:hypothetical protein